MTSFARARLVAAELAAGVTLLFSLFYIINFYAPGLVTLPVRGSALAAIALSIIAFVLSVKIRSPVVAGLLVAAGLVIQVPPVQAIAEAGVIAFPGPILGVVSFVIVLLLGIIKAIGLRVNRHPDKTDGYLAR